MRSDEPPFRRSEAVEHTVVQFNEGVQQATRGIEFQRQAGFGKVHLNACRPFFQAVVYVASSLLNEIVKKNFARITGQPVLRI